MKKLIIGCDPDVDGKGFAIYEDGVLFHLDQYSLLDLYALFLTCQSHLITTQNNQSKFKIKYLNRLADVNKCN